MLRYAMLVRASGKTGAWDVQVIFAVLERAEFGMENCRSTVVLMGIVFFALFGLVVPASADQCLPKRLDWMLDEEKCGDLVFADVIEIMHTCEDVQLRARAAAGLGRYRGPEVFGALYRVLESDRSPRVREAALNALDSIVQRTELKPGREIIEAYFLVYQFDRYAPNRSRARKLLESIGADPTMLKARAYISARYKVLLPLQVYASSTFKSARSAELQPDEYLTISDELYSNDQKTCWFSIKTSAGITGWVCGLQDSREYFGTSDTPPRPFESPVRSLAEISNPDQTVALELRTNKPNDTFRPGEEIAFFVKADQNCFITLIYFTPQSGGYILFPNRDQADSYISAGTEVRIPSEGSPLVFKASTPGVEQISVIATRMPIEIFPSQELEPGPVSAIKIGPQETARGIDRLLRYFKTDLWAIAHRSITILE